MKKFSKHTPEQIVRKLEQADKLQAAGSTVAQVCRQLQISEATFARWRKQYGTMSRTEAREFQKLREENARLKRLLDKSRMGKGQHYGSWLKAKLLTPACKYAAVDHLIDTMGLSQRLACRVVGVSRSAYGYAKNHARNLSR